MTTVNQVDILSGAAIGQLLTMVFKIVLMFSMINQLAKMEYSFWHILVNKIRYIFKVRAFGREDGRYVYVYLNEPFKYLQTHREYKWVALCLVTQVISEFAMLNDFQSGNYATKSALWFISSPGQSVSLAIAFSYMFARMHKLEKESRSWKVQALELKRIIDENHYAPTQHERV